MLTFLGSFMRGSKRFGVMPTDTPYELRRTSIQVLFELSETQPACVLRCFGVEVHFLGR